MMLQIREIRKKIGLKQEDLAKLIGISRTQISRWESGEAPPNIRWIEKIAKALGVTPQDLVATANNSHRQSPHPFDQQVREASLACAVALATLIGPYKLSDEKASRILEKAFAYFWDDFRDGNPPTDAQIKKYMVSLIN